MKAVVLGAGPAGMTAALHLAERGADVTVVDRHPFVGGAAASQPIGDGHERMDFGPHAFHLKDPDINKVFLHYAGGDVSRKHRNERILVRGCLFRYPLEIGEVLSHLSFGHVLWMGAAFALARTRFRLLPRPDTDFEAWGVNRFGRPLYDFTCGKYTEKVWGVRPSRLSAKLAQQKLKDLRLRDLLAKILGGRGQEHKQYWEDYAYPPEGIGVVFENMAKRICELSGRVILAAPLARVLADSRRARAITVRHSDGSEEEIRCDLLINTVPLTHLASALERGDSHLAIPSANGLRYRGLVLINVVFNLDQVVPFDWVYLLDEVFRCNRFTEQKNMGGKMIPPGKTVLCFELGASPGDAFWEASDKALFQVALDDIRNIGFMAPSRIERFHVARLEDAYPMYSLDFDERLNSVIQTLARTENIFTIGRQGLFLNNDVHDSMQMGKLAADISVAGRGTSEWYTFATDYIRGRIEGSR